MSRVATEIERQMVALYDSLNPKALDNCVEDHPNLIPQDQMTLDLGQEFSPPRLALELVHQAWRSEGAKRKRLAIKAIDLDPLCADAYLILSEEAKTFEEAQQACVKAVGAARMALPESYFTDAKFVGRFWRILETRPYMRALAQMAQLYCLGEDLESAISISNELLRLNPNDNQGIRFELVPWLIEAGRDAEAWQILSQYDGDPDAGSLYSRALLYFRESGVDARSRASLTDAIGTNPYILSVLAEDELPPMPDVYELGAYTEAIVIVRNQLGAWFRTDGALDWLFNHAEWMLHCRRRTVTRPGRDGLRLGEVMLDEPKPRKLILQQT